MSFRIKQSIGVGFKENEGVALFYDGIDRRHFKYRYMELGIRLVRRVSIDIHTRIK